jgi:hypothetical protein
MDSRVIRGSRTIAFAGRAMSVSPKTVLSTWAAIVALWAPAYLALLDHTGSGARTEALEWALLVVGAAGLASIVYAAWRDTRDPAWRAAHPEFRRGRARRG